MKNTPKFLGVGLLSASLIPVAAAVVPNAGAVARDAETEAVQFPSAPRFEVRDIRVEDASLLPEGEIRALIAPHIGKSTTLEGLQGLAEQITARYRAAGYPLAVAVVPPQRIENGIVRLRVVEGGIGAVRVENASRLSDYTVRAHLSPDIRSGRPFRQSDAETRLLRLRRLAGVGDADYRLSPSAQQGKTDIAVVLGKAPLLSGAVEVDNYGNKSTGRIRSHLAVHANSPFGRGERFSLKAMSSFKGVHHARLSADVPVGARGTAVSAGVGHTRYELGGAFKNLDASGYADNADVSLRHPIVLQRKRNLWLDVGAERRKLRDEIGATDTVTRKRIRSFHFGLNGGIQDEMLAGGYTALGLNATVGRLHIVDDDARALDAAAAKTQGHFHKLNAHLSHTRFFTPKLSLSGNVRGQWTDKNLDSGEQMSVGGADGVAGYRSNDVSADTGVIAQAELRYAVNPHFALSGFADAARLKQQRKPYFAAKNGLSLRGFGVGAQMRIKGFSLESKLAVRGSNEGASGKRKMWWLRAGYTF